MIICGPTMAGKSFFLNSLLLNWEEHFPEDDIRRVILVHKFSGQPCYDVLRRHFGDKLLMTKQFSEKLLDTEYIGKPDQGYALIIIDDCLHECVTDPLLTSIAVGGVHHLKICLFIVAHQLYASRHVNWITCSRNASMIALFQAPRDMSVLQHLNRQLYPKVGGKNYVAEAYELAVRDQLRYNANPYGYLLIDCTIQCPRRCRLKTGLVKGEEKFCYVTP